MNANQVIASIIHRVNKWIYSKEFLCEHRKGSAFTRKGQLSFSNMIYYTLQVVPKSILSNYAKLRHSLMPLRLTLVSKQAICKAPLIKLLMHC